MSYATIETALLTLILAYSGGTVFTAALRNATRGDYRAMDATGTAVSAVVVQSADSIYGYTAPGSRGTHGKEAARHLMGIDLFVKRGQALGGDGVAYTTLITLRDALIAHLHTTPRLNNTADLQIARVIGATRPIMLRDKDHAYSRITIEAIELYALGWTESPQ
jgi:hypothetical protein